MHELDPAFGQMPIDVKRWRKAERARLIGERLAIGSDVRQRHADRICAVLAEHIADPCGLVVSAYWPFRGEPDLRPLLRQIAARGGQPALPVVVERNRPLRFRAWDHGDPLERGVWNIPIPKNGQDVCPDIVIAPVVGFDVPCYRLGYGGGYFDRTLAALPKKPRVFGVGYSQAAVATIYPQPHDIPMDLIVTEKGVVLPASAME